MGTWGTSLYANDSACDLQDTVALLAKMPRTGNELLRILKEPGLGFYCDDESDPEANLFWYVLAEQFEKRGIACDEVFQQAKARLAREPGPLAQEFDANDARKWQQTCDKLVAKLSNPRPPKPRTARRLPPFLLKLGEVFTAPTQRGVPFNAWYSSWEEAKFEPDGWRSFVVLDRGRLFEWFAWHSVANFEAPEDRALRIEDLDGSPLALMSKALPRLVTRTHLKRMQAQTIAKVQLDPNDVAQVELEDEVIKAVLYGWSISTISAQANVPFSSVRYSCEEGV